VIKYRLGWRPDVPDVRDLVPEHIAHKHVGLKRAGLCGADGQTALPPAVDLRQWCPPIYNQLSLSSCTAHAGCALYEYFERKSFGKSISGSRLFLYKVTRNLLKETGDNGAMLRTTMQAIATFGICPEEHWEYVESRFEIEPTSFCYSYAANFQALKYFRLDTPEVGKEEVLRRIKEYLSRGYAIMFGFSVYDSIERMMNNVIPFPTGADRLEGGHAVATFGYDDARNALLIRNSWGPTWGDGGYGWLPYDYVLKGLTEDYWSITSGEYIDSGQFA